MQTLSEPLKPFLRHLADMTAAAERGVSFLAESTGPEDAQAAARLERSALVSKAALREAERQIIARSNEQAKSQSGGCAKVRGGGRGRWTAKVNGEVHRNVF